MYPIHDPLLDRQSESICTLCQKPASPKSPLYHVPCNCPAQVQPLIHQSCASAAGALQSSRCEACAVFFNKVIRTRTLSRNFWKEVILGTFAGFVEPFIFFIYIVLGMKLLDYCRINVGSEFFLGLRFWIVPLVSFPVWTLQRILLSRYRVAWLRSSRPWSCIAFRTIIGLVVFNAEVTLFPGEDARKFQWKRLAASLLCDVLGVAIFIAINVRLAPLWSLPFAPLLILLISLAMSVCYATMFRKSVTEVLLGPVREKSSPEHVC